MTKAAALAAARRQMSYGHYALTTTTTAIDCPVCRTSIRSERLPWEDRLPGVRAALVTHLREEH